jgi:hypothetical protein
MVSTALEVTASATILEAQPHSRLTVSVRAGL